MSRIFVFGSNLAGVHGAGSARHALRNHGAVWGVGEGAAGDSYAIPTKCRNLKTLPLDRISSAVIKFILHAKLNPDVQFDVVEVGCGLAGYKPEQIAPMFRGHPDNVNLPESFKKVLDR